MKTLLIVLACCGVISKVSSFTCQKCSATNSSNCTGSSDRCGPMVNLCFSGVIAIQSNEINITIPQKSCGFPGISTTCYSITINDTHISAKSEFCMSENCNEDIPQIPPRNMTKNGLKCPFCVNPALGGCTPKNQTLCTGLEDWCINFSGYLSLGGPDAPISYQGCATQSACPGTAKAEKSGTGISCTKAVRHCPEEDDGQLPVIN
ncbi:phospholipase A2 inhibitor and Ly6/PLAUR domain-containing protein-like [Leptodactylus fuscus]|uniref:phospholipase A2 inhibitor and Ly6/PLAUR domain-containing protein-like n=1 Tax=Leptodactylus fuscus TaxID=238119 RepID=UPI003F4E48F1